MMVYREFIAPNDDQIIETLGVEPQTVPNAESAKSLLIETEGGDKVYMIYDTLGRSIRLQWDNGSTRHVDVFREGAVRMHISSDENGAAVQVDFQTDSIVGAISVLLSSSVSISDRLLLQ